MVRAVDRVYALVREGILDGRYAPGVHLGETELAESIGASRTPVREALRRLEMEGLVEVLPHRGARVVEWAAEDLDEIYNLRMLLEGFAVARAATRITSKDLDRMEELCGLMEEAAAPGPRQDLDRVTELNAEFHGLARSAAASKRLVTMLNSVVQLPLVVRTFHRYSPEDLMRSGAHHRELVAALRAGDAMWAESVMRSHVLAAKTVLLRSFCG
ncbi:DNA-binding GntR family transcriptional regulator [Lipingzhangella halophila]|uniref:DNA-binding GntR family transcriptional regulator n=1 Tax=Lipingzhangella halophila TaxID=1783352 RepID=A0A7W7W1A9_9ACTN|nr:GntR family transcriptional regulator [Lipingzhangella halophila]MBB4930451.1 DNA-binding GntR family transcriptional regulator [Lipingzhangella halophila]